MASIGINHVDLVSFDLQGGEPNLLESIDFNTLRIDVILVKVYAGNFKEKEILRQDIRALFKNTGLYDETKTFDDFMMFQRLDLSVES